MLRATLGLPAALESLLRSESGRTLREGGTPRFFLALSLGVAAAYVAHGLGLRLGDGPRPMLLLPVKAFESALWLGALPLALHAANRPELAPRKSGGEALWFALGVDADAQRRKRERSGMRLVLWAVLVPVVVVSVLSLALSPSLAALGQRLAMLGILSAACALCALWLGGLAALFARRGLEGRGALSLLFLFLATEVLSELADAGWLSVVGLPSELVRAAVGAMGWGKLE